jgi:hypothetical protein
MSDDFLRTGSVDVNKKIDAEKLTLNGLDIYRLRTTSGPMSVKLDQVDANTLYIGEALPGTLGSAAAWRIRKFLTAGSVSSMLYANGESSFTNIWDNRTGLSYA